MNSDVWKTLSPAVIAGLFSVILWYLNHLESKRKKRDERIDSILEIIERNTHRIDRHETVVSDLEAITSKLESITDVNGDGIRLIMENMLKQKHMEYMRRGYITSYEKSVFLQTYDVYHAKGGDDGTGTGWKYDICSLPVRDDLVVKLPKEGTENEKL